MASNSSPRLAALWEANILRPAVVALRVVITAGFALTALGTIVGGIRDADRGNDWALVFMALALVLEGLLYALLMVWPDLLKLPLDWERATARHLPDEGQGCRRYTGLLVGSDFLRISALAIALGTFLAVLHQLAPELFKGGGLWSWPVWWRWCIGLYGAGLLTGSIWGGAAAVRDDRHRVVLAGWFTAALAGVLLTASALANMLQVGPVAAVLMAGTAAALGLTAYRSWPDRPAVTGAAGVAAALLGIAAVLRVGDLAHLMTSIGVLISGWTDATIGTSWQLLETGAHLTRGWPEAALLSALAVLGFAMSLYYWALSDWYRTFLRIGERFAARRGRAQTPGHLVVLRGLLLTLILSAAGVLLLTAALGGQLPRPALQLLGVVTGGVPSVLVRVLLAAIPLLALVDVLTLLSDLARVTDRRAAPSVGGFPWLRALVGLIRVLLVVGAIGGVVAVAWLVQELGTSPLLVLLAIICTAVAYCFLVAVPAAFSHLIRFEANTRPAGQGTVGGSGRYPGVSFIIAFGRLMMVLAVLAIIGGTAVLTFGELATRIIDMGVVLATVLGGLVTAGVVAIWLGALPDLLSLLLSIERNLREGSWTLAEPESPAPRPTSPAEIPALAAMARSALDALGDRVASEPVVPPGDDGVLLEVRGGRGQYRVVSRPGETCPVLVGPDTAVLGRFTGASFEPATASEPEHQPTVRLDARLVSHATPMITAPPTPDPPDTTTGEGEGGFDVEPVATVTPGMGLPPVMAMPQSSADHEIDRTPQVRRRRPEAPVRPTPPRAPVANGAVPKSAPPQPSAPASVADSDRARAAARSGHWIEAATLPSTGDNIGARVQAALTELLLVRELQKRYPDALWRSGWRNGRWLLELEADSVGSDVAERFAAWARREVTGIEDYARRAVAGSLAELGRWPADEVRFDPAPDSPLFAPVWTTGSPGTGPGRLSTRTGALLVPRRQHRKHGLLLSVRDGVEQVVYGFEIH